MNNYEQFQHQIIEILSSTDPQTVFFLVFAFLATIISGIVRLANTIGKSLSKMLLKKKARKANESN
jgi:hypothetical protein